jgi:large subunit ribosomal protein L25
MKQTFDFNATRRELLGTGASRRSRRAGQVPGIVYGAGKPPVNILVQHNDLLHRLEHEAFYSHVLTMTLDGKPEKVVLKDMQRHPFKPRVLHVDLLRVDEKEAIEMHVPLHFLHQDTCIGVKQGGGSISHHMTEMAVHCLPKDLPEFIAVDVSALHIGQVLHLGELPLPAGVQAAVLVHGGDPLQPVVSCHAPRGGAATEA